MRVKNDDVYITFVFIRCCIDFFDYELFLRRLNSSAHLDPTNLRCFKQNGKSDALQKVDENTFDRYGDELVISLADYEIELVYQTVENGLYMILLQTFLRRHYGTGWGSNQFYYSGYPNLYTIPNRKTGQR